MNAGVPHPPCILQSCATCSEGPSICEEVVSRRERRKDLLSDSGSVSLWFAACQSLVPRSSSHPWFPRPQAVGAMSGASFYGFPLQAEFAAQMWFCPLTREDGWILFLRQHRLVGKERLSISPRDRRLATMAAVITFAPVAENIWDTKIN